VAVTQWDVANRESSESSAANRTRRERPRDRRAAQQRDELASLHSITSSAKM
jgi:hypothetical protein